MTIHQAFQSDKKFFALDKFPYGLNKSGEFTREQVILLEKHGNAYQAIHRGERSPSNDEESTFLKVCQGLEPAATVHEIVWMRYCVRTSDVTLPKGLSGSLPIGDFSRIEYDELDVG